MNTIPAAVPAKKARPQQQYTFGTLTLTFDGLGVPFLSDKTEALIAQMELSSARAINREAWKQRKQATRIANRHNNMSLSGNAPIYDQAAQHAMVAELICKAAYIRMKGAE